MGVQDMFCSMKMNRHTVIMLLSCVVVLAVLFVIDRYAGVDAVGAPDCRGATQAQRVQFLQQYGWEIEAESEIEDQVVIPQVFDEVFTQYNDIQTAQGFDLTAFAGKLVKRYTYRITNYPDCEDAVYANLLVSDGVIIGGDVCTYAVDGFLHGFDHSTTTGTMFGQSALGYSS